MADMKKNQEGERIRMRVWKQTTQLGEMDDRKSGRMMSSFTIMRISVLASGKAYKLYLNWVEIELDVWLHVMFWMWQCSKLWWPVALRKISGLIIVCIQCWYVLRVGLLVLSWFGFRMEWPLSVDAKRKRQESSGVGWVSSSLWNWEGRIMLAISLRRRYDMASGVETIPC